MTGTLYELALFAGAGGGILGGILRGHVTVGAVEIEPYPREVLLQRQRDGILPEFPVWDDVGTFRIDNPDCREYIEGLRGIGDRLVISGGFPCQDVSVAHGKGGEGLQEGNRSGLWFEMARIIGEVRPRHVFVENSPMLVSRGLDVVLGGLAEMGYDARWGIVSAENAFAPHQRKRMWIVANSRHWCGRDERAVERGSQQAGERAADTDPFGGSSEQRTPMAEGNVSHANGDGLIGTEITRGIGEALQEEQGRTVGALDASRTGRLPQAEGDVPDTDQERLEGPSSERAQRGERRDARILNGLPAWYGAQGERLGEWWSTEPDVGRVANGVARRVDRLKALGNGQVSAVVDLAWDILGGRQ